MLDFFSFEWFQALLAGLVFLFAAFLLALATVWWQAFRTFFMLRKVLRHGAFLLSVSSGPLSDASGAPGCLVLRLALLGQGEDSKTLQVALYRPGVQDLPDGICSGMQAQLGVYQPAKKRAPAVSGSPRQNVLAFRQEPEQRAAVK